MTSRECFSWGGLGRLLKIQPAPALGGSGENFPPTSSTRRVPDGVIHAPHGPRDTNTRKVLVEANRDRFACIRYPGGYIPCTI